MLDNGVCEKQSSLIEKLTTTGKTELDKELSRELWALTAISEDQLKFCHGKLMEYLEKKNAQIRYGSFLLIDDLFCRSEFYRQFFLARSFERFVSLTLTLKVDPTSRQPSHALQPRSVALKLKKDALRALQKWRLQFRTKHPQIVVGCLHIQQSMKIDIDGDEVKRNAEERRVQEVNESLLSSLRQEVELHTEDITSLIVEMDHSFCLLFEHTDAAPEDSDSESEAAHNLNIRGNKPEVCSSLPETIPRFAGELVVSEDNKQIIQNLKELYSLITNRHLPRVNDWMQRLQSISDSSGELTKRVESMRKLLLGAVNRYEDVRVVERADSSDCESEDDFEEVDNGDASWGVEDLPILKQQDGTSSSTASSFAVTSQPQTSSSNARVSKNMLQLESDESMEPGPSSAGSSVPHDPTKWSCRAVFPSGRLCPRMDIYKCPFHGKIIGRDKSGIPTDPKERVKEEEKQARQNLAKLPDWQDPKHLAEIKKKTGIDLTFRKRKRGRKSFAEKYPGLRDPSKLSTKQSLANKLFRNPREAIKSMLGEN